MSSSINTINGNGMSLQFEEFARLAGASTKGTNVVRFLGSSDAATVHEVAVTTSDKVGKWFRSDGVKAANDTTRAIFRQSIVDMFGGEALIPDNVKEAMKLKDYGKGKPLTAKRIQIVKAAVDAAMREFPTGRPRISAPTGQVRPAWPEIPSDSLTGKGLIEPENAVFRFNIGGQEFVGKVCGEKEKDNDQNRGIATAVENFCNAKAHPVQTNAVFFALAQGGLVPQMSLAEHGYKAADHTAVSYTLTKDADTGTVNIKYSNPEGSPLKFSWTATVDVNGKVVATPIQIEE